MPESATELEATKDRPWPSRNDMRVISPVSFHAAHDRQPTSGVMTRSVGGAANDDASNTLSAWNHPSPTEA